ncbi:MAG TPA: phospholipid carrier-dependent glycosyltransferase, partial [bacterium]|nr:phospholipid carrier-dependent glycosyltransferase [bacterium]
GAVMGRNDWFTIAAMGAVATFCFTAGLRWGLPSRERNSLCFTTRQSLEVTLQQLSEYQLEQAWKGMGAYLAAHPEEAGKKLSRSLYNPIRSYHPDEYFILKSLATMDPKRFDFHPHQFGVGGAYLYLVGGVIFLLSRCGLITVSQDLKFAFSRPEEFANLYLCGRAVTVLYGVATVVLFYLLAVRLLKKKEMAAVATWLLLWTPLMVLNTHYMYVDVPGLFWTVATLWFTFFFLSAGAIKWVSLAGVCAGLACGCKFTLLVTVVLPVLGILWQRTSPGRRLRNLLVAAGCFILAFGFTNPYFFLSLPEPLIDLSQHSGRAFQGGFYLVSLLTGMGWPLVIFLAAGYLLLACSGGREEVNRSFLSLLFVWSVFFFFFVASFAKTFARYLLPVVPALILLGSAGWLLPLTHKSFLKWVGTGFCCLVLIGTTLCGGAYLSLFLQENVRTRAGRWMKENLPAGARVGVTEEPWQFQLPDFDRQRFSVLVAGYDIESVKRLQPEYFLLSSFQAPLVPYPLKLNRERVIFWRDFTVLAWYQPVKTFQEKASLLGWSCQPEALPEDLIYINPTIVVFKKVRP